jgi:hypothetical protein
MLREEAAWSLLATRPLRLLHSFQVQISVPITSHRVALTYRHRSRIRLAPTQDARPPLHIQIKCLARFFHRGNEKFPNSEHAKRERKEIDDPLCLIITFVDD